ncbi:MAG: phospholipase D family protein [Desulfobulbaceae bacterium]|nr:phospholipase D family protein [Desulfobulbaceae bacterium]
MTKQESAIDFIKKKIRHLVCLSGIFSFFIFPSLANAEPIEFGSASLEEIIRNLCQEHPSLSGAFVLEKGEDALLTRAWLADRSVTSIDVQYFIWSTDNIGILAAESLLRAADRGTRIRVIVDDFMLDAPDESMLALAAHPNIEVRIYNPKNSVGVSAPERIFGIISNFRSFNQRMHDKTFIVDGMVAITGGRNMADEYFDYDHDYNFRDRDILLLGPVVVDMRNSFEQFWQSSLTVHVDSLLEREKKRLKEERIAEIYAELHAYASNPENFAPEVRQTLSDLSNRIPRYAPEITWGDILFVSDVPGKNQSSGFRGGGKTTAMLVDAVSKAKKSITIQSPYLIFPDDGIDFFAEFIRKGVEVKISTNSLASTDNLQAFSGYSKQRRKITKAGIKVYEFRPSPAIQKELIDRYEELEKNIPTFAIHAKTMVIDNELLFIGTFNLDPRSANLNTEVGVLIKDKQLASQVEEFIERDMLPENSWDVSTGDTDTNAPFWKQLQMSLWTILPIKSLL